MKNSFFRTLLQKRLDEAEKLNSPPEESKENIVYRRSKKKYHKYGHKINSYVRIQLSDILIFS